MPTFARLVASLSFSCLLRPARSIASSCHAFLSEFILLWFETASFKPKHSMRIFLYIAVGLFGARLLLPQLFILPGCRSPPLPPIPGGNKTFACNDSNITYTCRTARVGCSVPGNRKQVLLGAAASETCQIPSGCSVAAGPGGKLTEK